MAPVQGSLRSGDLFPFEDWGCHQLFEGLSFRRGARPLSVVGEHLEWRRTLQGDILVGQRTPAEPGGGNPSLCRWKIL